MSPPGNQGSPRAFCGCISGEDAAALRFAAEGLKSSKEKRSVGQGECGAELGVSFFGDPP